MRGSVSSVTIELVYGLVENGGDGKEMVRTNSTFSIDHEIKASYYEIVGHRHASDDLEAYMKSVVEEKDKIKNLVAPYQGKIIYSKKEEQRDYQRRLKDTRSYLETWKDELLLTSGESNPKPSQERSLSVSDVRRILTNFESALKRWSSEDRKKWSIDNEKDVQSILFLILRSYFDDLIYEDPTSKFGHGYSLEDFKIPSLNLLIEAKYVRSIKEFLKIENEIKQDIINYLVDNKNYKLIVFIYDDSSSVQDHQITIDSLKKIFGMEDVIIASRPSQRGLTDDISNNIMGTSDPLYGEPEKVKQGIRYYSSRSNLPNIDYVLSLRTIESIDILSITSYLLTLHNSKAIESAVNRGIKVTILILNSTDTKSVTAQNQIYDEDVGQQLGTTIEELCKIKKTLTRNKIESKDLHL
jgi:hypothetical protein